LTVVYRSHSFRQPNLLVGNCLLSPLQRFQIGGKGIGALSLLDFHRNDFRAHQYAFNRLPDNWVKDMGHDAKGRTIMSFSANWMASIHVWFALSPRDLQGVTTITTPPDSAAEEGRLRVGVVSRRGSTVSCELSLDGPKLLDSHYRGSDVIPQIHPF
jgi:hypothetical protein